jgi:hypothetical protein
MFGESRCRLLREEKVSKCRCCYPSNERMNEWMDERTLLSPAANYPYYSCCLLPKNKRLIKEKTPATDPRLLNMPPTTQCLLPWQTSPALHFQCMPTVQSHSGNIVECGAVSPGKCFRVKQWKKVNVSGTNSGRKVVELRRRGYLSSERRELLTITWYGVTSPTTSLFRGRLRSLCGTTSLLRRTTVTSTWQLKCFVSQPRNTSRGLESVKGFVWQNGQPSRCRSTVLIHLLLC